MAEQVRLLAGARGVAGFGGAAMTNLMFAHDDARVLDLTCETTLWPDFSGMAIALGQHYRYLTGVVPQSCQSVRLLYITPVRLDLDLLERHLWWVRGTEG